MNRITIKNMLKSDVENVVRIEELSYGKHHWSKESFFNELNNELSYYYCAFNEDNTLMGYCGCWHILDEAHITTLSVSPDFRKQKVAQALLIKLFDDCYKEKIKYITLEVRESNIPAISLYEKNGFISIGERKGYYQDNNENALIMFTENIWYQKFSLLYNQNKEELLKQSEVVYG